MAFDDVCKGIYVTTRLRSFINCRINQGRTSNWKKDFLIDCVFFNNNLIQILRFAYFPITNSKGKNSFHRHFNKIDLKCFVSLLEFHAFMPAIIDENRRVASEIILR